MISSSLAGSSSNEEIGPGPTAPVRGDDDGNQIQARLDLRQFPFTVE